MSKRETIGILLVVTVALLLVTSCDPKKNLVSPTYNASNYEWMTAKMNGELITENGNFSFSGNLRMHRDSTIWMSISAFMGMESLRALMTQDTVLVVNRLNQTYLAEPVSTVVEKMHVPSLQDTQTMLVGNGTSDHVELRWGPYTAKIRYSDIQWNEPTTFPIKINKGYERMKL